MNARLTFLSAALLIMTVSSFANAGGYAPANGGHNHGHAHGWAPQPKIVYETRFRIEKITKYREELCTTIIEKKIRVPRQVVKTEYKMVPEIVSRTVTEFKTETVDKGHYARQAYVDAWGCTQYKQVWCPNLVTIKIPCERVIKETIMKKVPYQVTCTVYEEVIQKVPVTEKKMVPYIVEQKVPYKVAKKVWPSPKPSNPWTPAGYHH